MFVSSRRTGDRRHQRAAAVNIVVSG